METFVGHQNLPSPFIGIDVELGAGYQEGTTFPNALASMRQSSHHWKMSKSDTCHLKYLHGFLHILSGTQKSQHPSFSQQC